MFKPFLSTVSRFVVFLFLITAFLKGQSSDVIVSGTITDPSGAVVAGATVTAKNNDTGVLTTTQTNGSGVYVFPPLLYGHYDFSAEHAGFRKAVVENALLEAGAKLTLNQVLQIGTTAETIEVEASASTL